jgi:flagella basal body P-ring formation protein FlgA
VKAYNFLLVFSLIFTLPITHADEYASTDDIRAQVKTFLHEKLKQQLVPGDHKNVKINVRQIDPRLRLAKCDKSLTMELQGQKIHRSASVKVSCISQKRWSIYIGSTIRLEKPVYVLRHSLNRKDLIGKNDLTTAIFDVYALRASYSTNSADIIGKQLKRPLKAGQVIYSYHLQAPEIIKKGDLVSIVAKRGSLSVVVSGIALNNASIGERLRVENQHSSRIIDTKVTGPGTVEVL